MTTTHLPADSAAVRDSVIYEDIGTGAFLNTTYGHCSPTFPNPLIVFPEILKTTYGHVYESLPWDGIRPWLAETWEYHYTDVYLSVTNLYHILFVALLISVIRYTATHAILKRIPVWYKCIPSEGDKFPEAAFRVVIYAIAWGWTAYVTFNHDYFHSPYKALHDFVPGLGIPTDVYWLYMFELGLYVHSIYATLFIEVIRRDFAVQLIHHVVTILLLGYSFSVRLYALGVLVLFMHDFGDVLIEMAKCCIYFKVRDGKACKLPELLANVLFAMFTLNWILFRLYWLPCKAIYASGHVSKNFMRPAPHYLFPNILLWILYVLHWYWFHFIVKMVIHVLFGKEAIDNREYEEEQGKRVKRD